MGPHAHNIFRRGKIERKSKNQRSQQQRAQHHETRSRAMTMKSNNQKRGGKRPGAGRPRGSVGPDEARNGSSGRRPNAAEADWEAVGRAYFTGTDTIEDICSSFGLTYGDLLAHAAGRHWIRPSPKPHPDDIGELASALALAMFSVDGVSNRARCFVAAMVKLEATVADIADVLRVSKSSLQADFARELDGVRG
jgi:hypothetical protein